MDSLKNYDELSEFRQGLIKGQLIIIETMKLQFLYKKNVKDIAATLDVIEKQLKGDVMTINGVEQNCIKSQSIVYLLDVFQEGSHLDRNFTTTHQYRKALIEKARSLNGRFNRKARQYLLSVVNKSFTTADEYKAAIKNKMDELRSEMNAK